MSNTSNFERKDSLMDKYKGVQSYPMIVFGKRVIQCMPMVILSQSIMAIIVVLVER